MGQKHSGGGGGTRVDGGGRTVVVIGGGVDAGHRGGGGDAIGIINEDDESEAPETCTKSFSDNNLAWYSRPWKIIESPTEPIHRKPPSVEVLTSSSPSSNNAPSQTRGRSRPKSAGLPRQRPSSGLFWKPPPMPWFGRSASKTNGGSTATIAGTDLTGVINSGGQQRPVRPVTVVGAPGNSNADDATYRSMLAAAGREKSPAAVEKEMDDGRRHVTRVVGRPIIEEVLRQTVDFLVHEIEPVLIAEYLKHQRRSRRRNGKQAKPNGVVGGDVTPSSPSSSPAFMNERELRALLADIILGPSTMMTDDADFRHQNETTVADQNGTDSLSGMSPSTASCWSSEDDFWTFCRLLRKLDADRKSGEFLEALGAVLRIVAPCRCHHCSVRPAGGGVLPGSTRTTSSRQASTPGDAPVDEHGLHERVADSEEDSSDPDDDVSDAAGRRRRRHQFDVKIVYVDSETRVPRSFDDVAQLKRCRRRKSRIGLVPKENDAKLQQQQHQQHHPAVVVGDTADRYIPMVVVRVSGLDGLCEVRTRRIEHLLDDFPERILRLTIADVDLDPSSTLRLSRAVERHPATGLRTLRVVRSSLGNDGATLLATGLSHNTGLRSLCLAGNGMTSRGCAIVVRALLRRSTPCGTGGRTLTELDISDNPGIGDAGFRSLLSALRLPGCPLRRLSVRRVGLGPSAAGDLFAALGRNSRLVALDVGGNRLVDRQETNVSGSIGTTTNERDGEKTDAGGDGPTAFVRLAESLIVNRTLRDLVADDECGAAVDECRQLARALRTNTAVRRLRLDGNAAIGDAGAELLADGLRYNRGGIEELGLAGCSIGDRGLAAIVDAATRYNSTTKLIDLRRCRRRRSGASVSVSSSPPIIQRQQQQQQQSDCFVLTGRTRTVPLESPDSDGNSCSMPAAEAHTVAEDDDAFSAAPPSSPSVVNGLPENSPGRMDYAKRCFDPQLVELVEGLSRPRIILD